jgi:peptidoglycan/xylan/chitin deacetylase (PgdA/CDA1 family)
LKSRLALLACCALLGLAGGRGVWAAPPASVPARARLSLQTNWDEWQLRFEESLKRQPALVYSVRVNEKLVALSVDDGPDPRFTPALLGILEWERVPATFFVVGRNVALYPDLLRREVEDGNEIGNHTFSHPELASLSREALRTEMAQGEAAVASVTGLHPLLFRPPKGYLDRAGLETAAAAGYRVVLWSVAVEHHDLLTPEALASRVVRLVEPGAIILLHDGRLDRTRSIEALPLIIRGLRRRGYRFVTVGQLLEQGQEQNRLRIRGLGERWLP